MTTEEPRYSNRHFQFGGSSVSNNQSPRLTTNPSGAYHPSNPRLLGPLKLTSNFHSNDSAVLQQRLADLEAELNSLDAEYDRLQVENEELKEQHEDVKNKNKLLFEQITTAHTGEDG